MKNVMKGIIGMVAVASLLLILQSNAWAKKGGDKVPPGQAKKAAATSQASTGHTDTAAPGTPPGWSHGKKTGWHGSPYPPGWSKWDSK
ncbi:MAG: hypothetical protein WC956_09445, partial [bacterium]